jgi:hypothetical protein
MTTNVSGTFTGSGVSSAIAVHGRMSILIDGGSGDVEIERSTDDGATWFTISRDSAGNPALYATATLGFNGFVDEPEFGIKYRLNCSAFTSGTITYRLGSRDNA